MWLSKLHDWVCVIREKRSNLCTVIVSIYANSVQIRYSKCSYYNRTSKLKILLAKFYLHQFFQTRKIYSECCCSRWRSNVLLYISPVYKGHVNFLCNIWSSQDNNIGIPLKHRNRLYFCQLNIRIRGVEKWLFLLYVIIVNLVQVRSIQVG